MHLRLRPNLRKNMSARSILKVRYIHKTTATVVVSNYFEVKSILESSQLFNKNQPSNYKKTLRICKQLSTMIKKQSIKLTNIKNSNKTESTTSNTSRKSE